MRKRFGDRKEYEVFELENGMRAFICDAGTLVHTGIMAYVNMGVGFADGTGTRRPDGHEMILKCILEGNDYEDREPEKACWEEFLMPMAESAIIEVSAK